MSDRTSKISTHLKLFYSLFRSNNVNKEQTQNNSNSEETETDSETSMERPLIEDDEPELETSIEERPEIAEKNKWLYPTGFGKMEEGVVDNDSIEAHERTKKGDKKNSRKFIYRKLT